MMTASEKREFFQRHILAWFRTHKRDLPWRRTHDPYRILVSEIMLQQTQVDRVVPKYAAFLKKYPTIQQLASAQRSAVIKLWSGLGYNNRAVRLHRAAQTIVAHHLSKVPRSFGDLVALPGIGTYTAHAILSFAFGQHVAAVDVNHARAVVRVFFGMKSPSQKIIESLAYSLLPKREANGWNQALMDFGALVCTARPRCQECPMQQECRAYPKILLRSTRRHSKKESFAGSNRYFRGRIVEQLREKPQRVWVRQSQLWAEIDALSPILPERFSSLIVALAKDGILRLHRRGSTTQVRFV